MAKFYIASSPWIDWSYHESPDHSERRTTVTFACGMTLSILTFSLATILTQPRAWVVGKFLVSFLAPLSPNIPRTATQAPRPQPDGVWGQVERIVAILAPWSRPVAPTRNDDQAGGPYELNTLTEQVAARSVLHRRPFGGQEIRPYGVLAIFNSIFFVIGPILWAILTGVMPQFLMYWQKEPPLVLSRSTGECAIIPPESVDSANIAQLSDAFYRLCWLNETHTADMPFCGTAPIVAHRLPPLVEETTDCPWNSFPESPCRKGNYSVTISHENLLAKDVGVNSAARLSMTHRLVCSPLELSNYVIQEDEGEYWVQFSEPGRGYGVIWHGGLYTPNGPNRWSNELSGHDAFFRGDWDLLLWPRIRRRAAVPGYRPEDALGNKLSLKDLEHQNLSDATIFVIGYEAGNTGFAEPVDDPLFGAHQMDEEGIFGYMADYELTAIACAEQYRLFQHRGKRHGYRTVIPLTPWVSQFNFTDPAFWETYRAPILAENKMLIQAMAQYTSVHDHLRDKPGVQALMAGMKIDDRRRLQDVDPRRQWIKELVAGVEIGIVNARYSFLHMVTGQPKERGSHSDSVPSLCDQVLISDTDYINIRWGLWGLWGPFLIQVIIWVVAMFIEKGGELLSVWEAAVDYAQRGTAWMGRQVLSGCQYAHRSIRRLGRRTSAASKPVESARRNDAGLDPEI